MTVLQIKPIKDEIDYAAALAEIDRLMDAAPNTPEGDRLDVWVTLVEAYEQKQDAIEEPDPIAAILHRMEALDMTHEDLENLIGGQRRVSEIVNRRRPLSLDMIRRLHQVLQIPTDILIQPYELRPPDSR